MCLVCVFGCAIGSVLRGCGIIVGLLLGGALELLVFSASGLWSSMVSRFALVPHDLWCSLGLLVSGAWSLCLEFFSRDLEGNNDLLALPFLQRSSPCKNLEQQAAER